jgi:hypothetical protein
MLKHARPTEGVRAGLPALTGSAGEAVSASGKNSAGAITRPPGLRETVRYLQDVKRTLDKFWIYI